MMKIDHDRDDYKRNLDEFYVQSFERRGDSSDTGVSRSKRLAIVQSVLNTYARDQLARMRALDYGTGSGWLLYELETYPFQELHAFDVTPSTTQVVKEKHEAVQVWTGDTTYPTLLPSNHFDFVTSIEVLEHIPNPLKSDYFQDLRRICRTGAKVVITTPNAKFKAASLPDGSPRQPVEDWVSIDQISSLAHGHHFRVAETGSRSLHSFQGTWNMLLYAPRVRHLIKRLRQEEHYCAMLERLHRGITLYSILEAV